MANQESAAAHLRGREVLQQEAASLCDIAEHLGSDFDAAVRAILDCRGRVVLTGMGKHGIVARKISATLASTGTPAFFLHPAEACHGDLGSVTPDDLIVAVSNSGNTAEVVACVPYFKRLRNKLIAMTGNLQSELARNADIVLDIGVKREVCPLNLAPTTSTTVAVALGDAIAVVLLELRGFKEDDFAVRHPSGALGKRLLLRVSDLMRGERNPTVSQTAKFEEAIAQITRHKLGAVSVVNETGELCGILTDGDLRRIFQRAAQESAHTVADVLATRVSEIMTRDPASIPPDTLAAKALSLMEDGARKIFVLPVVDGARRPVGMLHLHDLIAAGV